MHAEVQKARHFFTGNDFHRNLFDATIANYNDRANPLRFNNFAYAARELLREKLDSEAPDTEITRCSWYVPNPQTGKPTRVDKVRFYIAKGIADKYISTSSKERLDSAKEDYKKLLELLNKFTHITLESFAVADSVADDWFRETLRVIAEFMELSNEIEEDLKKETIDTIQSDIALQLFENMPDELDVLSTHTRFEDIDSVEMEIDKVDSQSIYISGSCSVNVDLQYGSDLENERDGGVPIGGSYPMDFSVIIASDNFRSREYNFSEIDTSDFYGEEET